MPEDYTLNDFWGNWLFIQGYKKEDTWLILFLMLIWSSAGPDVLMHTLGMLEMAMWRGSRMIRMVKLALKAGSSKHGKAPRAKVASNCVDAMALSEVKYIQHFCFQFHGFIHFHLDNPRLGRISWRIYFVTLPDLPTAGTVAAFVETVKAVWQVCSKLQLDLILSALGENRLRQQSKLMETRVLQNPEGPDALRGQEHHVGYVHFFGMDNNCACVFFNIQTNSNHTSEVQGGEVWVNGQVIVQRADG